MVGWFLAKEQVGVRFSVSAQNSKGRPDEAVLCYSKIVDKTGDMWIKDIR